MPAAPSCGRSRPCPTIGFTRCPIRRRRSPGCCGSAAGQGEGIAAEVWSLDPAAFGAFVAKIPAPLGIGTLRLFGRHRGQGLPRRGRGGARRAGYLRIPRLGEFPQSRPPDRAGGIVSGGPARDRLSRRSRCAFASRLRLRRRSPRRIASTTAPCSSCDLVRRPRVPNWARRKGWRRCRVAPVISTR